MKRLESVKLVQFLLYEQQEFRLGRVENQRELITPAAR